MLTRDGMMNEATLQFKDEFVRHKVLDLIGDLALLGSPLLARVNAHRAGHALHTALVSRILKDRTLWELVELGASDEASTSGDLWKKRNQRDPAPVLF